MRIGIGSAGPGMAVSRTDSSGIGPLWSASSSSRSSRAAGGSSARFGGTPSHRSPRGRPGLRV